MTRSVLLDTGVLTLLTHSEKREESTQCKSWMTDLLLRQWECVVPEICDFELRRHLLRRGLPMSIENLDRLAFENTYLPIDTATMRTAARLWSDLRKRGQQTASDRSLDADVILGAHAVEHEKRGASVIIATTNVKHLSRMCEARRWQDIE